jgi:hypothetical protein
MVHALDHLTVLHEDLARIPPAVSGWQPPASFQAGARALGSLLDATKDLQSAVDPAVFTGVEDASKQLSAERKTSREKLLEDLALQRIPTATARAGLEALMWADLTLHHSWRLAESLRASSGEPTGE